MTRLPRFWNKSCCLCGRTAQTVFRFIRLAFSHWPVWLAHCSLRRRPSSFLSSPHYCYAQIPCLPLAWVLNPSHLLSSSATSRLLCTPWSAEHNKSMSPLPPSPGDLPAIDGGSCASTAGDNGACLQHEKSGYDASCTHCSRTDPLPSSISGLSASSLILDSVPLKDSEKIRRVVTALAKGFTIGAGLKGGLALFSILARLRRRLSASKQWVSPKLLNLPSTCTWDLSPIPFLIIGPGSNNLFLVDFAIFCV